MSPVKAVTAAIVVLGACSSAPLVPYSADTPPLVRVPASAAGKRGSSRSLSMPWSGRFGLFTCISTA